MRKFFSQLEAKSKPKPITPCTREFSRALSKLQVIVRYSDWFIALIAPVVIGQSFGFSTVSNRTVFKWLSQAITLRCWLKNIMLRGTGFSSYLKTSRIRKTTTTKLRQLLTPNVLFLTIHIGNWPNTLYQMFLTCVQFEDAFGICFEKKAFRHKESVINNDT